MKRIALIGCGAIASSFHLPALTRLTGQRISLVLVDPNRDRAQALADRYKLRETASSHADVVDELDGAIIATPHHLHLPIGLSLLEHGVSILSEKPLGTSVLEIEQLEEASARSGSVIAVNQTRRFIPACREIRRRFQSGELGAIQRIRMDEGDRFGWPSASPAMFGARSGGKGVLLDVGVHALDLLTWWLGDQIQVVSYEDDSMGGSEAAAHAVFCSASIEVELRLSWLAKRPNQYVIEGSHGTLSWDVYDLDRVTLTSEPGGRPQVIRLSGAPASFDELAHPVILDFLEALETGRGPTVGPLDVLPSMKLIEACYAQRNPFSMSWHGFALPAEVKD